MSDFKTDVVAHIRSQLNYTIFIDDIITTLHVSGTALNSVTYLLMSRSMHVQSVKDMPWLWIANVANGFYFYDDNDVITTSLVTDEKHLQTFKYYKVSIPYKKLKLQ